MHAEVKFDSFIHVLSSIDVVMNTYHKYIFFVLTKLGLHWGVRFFEL